ncbi:zonadhesin,-like [Plakobranchus ocellatus]|uniref:Zonadhesin,-like n=1 Tax=Plakobranchus ocellatus TaxID=259542 RepID=A0AAV4CEU6_9GAST|nr:zonadhesin,-like [Plakobranchus ocellatus]
MFEACILDVCTYFDQPEVVERVVCMANEAVASFCESSGLPVTWRTSVFCPLACPANSHYSPLMSGCQPSCPSPVALDPLDCPLAEREGCECDAGYVLDKGQCIFQEDCGCRDVNAFYIPSNTSYTTPDCSRTLECRPSTFGSTLHVTKHESPPPCPPEATCVVSSAGQRSCKCRGGYVDVGGTCVKVVSQPPPQTILPPVAQTTPETMVIIDEHTHPHPPTPAPPTPPPIPPTTILPGPMTPELSPEPTPRPPTPPPIPPTTDMPGPMTPELPPEPTPRPPTFPPIPPTTDLPGPMMPELTTIIGPPATPEKTTVKVSLFFDPSFE